ncbi:sensor domain-containing diguanylate cyclase [Rhodococcus opacus]|nr:sensor domain-containing diguanylate cyclase [Rhodococcus opacus]MDJ0419007.1 sensor domain-containing diguanylate cyclase [Rhodococcus opacus]
MLLAVLEHTPALVFVSEFVSGRIVYVNPAGVGLLGLGDAVHAYARTTAELFTDVGLVQAREVESALVERGGVERADGIPPFRDGRADPDADHDIRAAAHAHRAVADRLDCTGSPRRRRGRTTLAPRSGGVRVPGPRAAGDRRLEPTRGRRGPRRAPRGGGRCGRRTDGCAVLVDRADVRRRRTRRAGLSGTRALADDVRPGKGLTTRVATASGAVIVCADRVHETRFSTVGMTRRGLHSGVCVPIGAEAVWGVLTAHSRRPREYTDRDLTFLRSVTAVLSAAIRRIEAEAALVYQSLHDPLTGLPNRALARRRLDDAMDAAPRGGTRVALLLVDLDDFKIVNDSLGHAGGDDALVVLARHLRSAVRPGDTVARLGGDEFVVVCEHVAGAAEAVAIAARITGSVADLNRAGSLDWPISASIGVALSDPECTREELVRRADSAMYRAKAAGAGGYAFYGGPF